MQPAPLTTIFAAGIIGYKSSHMATKVAKGGNPK
jgi:hypothetical protein